MIAIGKSSIAKIRKPWWGILYLIIMTIGIWSALSQWAYDDPFISYRYAANLASGLGFVYNPGERVLSTTTPLFVILLALFNKIGFSVPLVANAISVISLSVGGLLIWILAQLWKTSWVGWAGLLLYPTFSLLLRTIGSETPFYLALGLGSFVLYARKQLGWAAILIALSTLTRSDGILVAVIIGIDFLWHNRSDLKGISFWSGLPWKGFTIAVGLLLAWHLFSWGYFDSPFPATLAAKQAQGAMAVSTLFAPGILRITGWYVAWPNWIAFGLVLIGVIYAFVRSRPWLLVFAWMGLYFLAYTLLGVSSYYWYYAPLVPAWVVAIGLGLTWLASLSLSNRIRNFSWLSDLQYVLVILIMATLFLSQISSLIRLWQTSDARFSIYKAAGSWLADHTSLDATVGALEVGIIGYFAQRPMIDFAGLIQPEVAQKLSYDTTYEDSAFWAVEEYQPDYLVLFPEAFPLLAKDYVAESCELAHAFRGTEYSFPNDLLIFDCRK